MSFFWVNDHIMSCQGNYGSQLNLETMSFKIDAVLVIRTKCVYFNLKKRPQENKYPKKKYVYKKKGNRKGTCPSHRQRAVKLNCCRTKQCRQQAHSKNKNLNKIWNDYAIFFLKQAETGLVVIVIPRPDDTTFYIFIKYSGKTRIQLWATLRTFWLSFSGKHRSFLNTPSLIFNNDNIGIIQADEAFIHLKVNTASAKLAGLVFWKIE